MKNIKLTAPFQGDTLKDLTAGDYVFLSGTILTGRDAAHKRLFDALKSNSSLPVDLKNQAIYYVGACFDKQLKPTAAGPTTSMRMDAYAPTLYDSGLRATIGKGDRGDEVYASIRRNGGVYLAAIGGAGAVYANAVKKAELVCYEDLGTEAIYRFEVEDFPLIVAIDSKGNSIYSRV